MVGGGKFELEAKFLANYPQKCNLVFDLDGVRKNTRIQILVVSSTCLISHGHVVAVGELKSKENKFLKKKVISECCEMRQ